MFNSSRSFLLTLLSLTAVALVGAAPHGASYSHGQPPNGVAHTHIQRHGVHNGTALSLGGRAHGKRFDNARFTFYDAGENACGSVDDGNAFVIALSPSMYNNGAHCYKQVTVEYKGKQVQATVTDECPGCNDVQADLSRPLFAALAPLDEGEIFGSWWFD
ncbi:RlpA-like double-psi beta-barrel-protein domain-containing protein-containing protein [Lenzites betulinus]|nr:RlpA-like double-psi beta-barrel-protein domain-containing protein-containing protein [Lenzites betulinus]